MTKVISTLGLSLAASACARPGGAPPPTTAKDAREPASVAIEYEVTRKGEGDGGALHGRTSVDARHEPCVEHRLRGREELCFETRERNDGSFDVQVKYREDVPDGTSIHWEPLLRVARGGTVIADVSGAGWSREVRLKVD
jgi:hypothetical protein